MSPVGRSSLEKTPASVVSADGWSGSIRSTSRSRPTASSSRPWPIRSIAARCSALARSLVDSTLADADAMPASSLRPVEAGIPPIFVADGKANLR